MEDEKYYEIWTGDFIRYVKHSINNAFNFSGRASRKEYVVCLVATTLYSFVLIALNNVYFFATSVAEGVASSGIVAIDSLLVSLSALIISLVIPLSSVYILLAFFVMFVSLSVSIRRLHDSDNSGWRVIPIFIVVGLCTLLVGALLGLIYAYLGVVVTESSNSVLGLFTVLFLWVIQYGLLYLIMVQKPSDLGDNTFGEPAVYED